MRLLIVDDYPPFAQSMRLLLSGRHTVVVELSGQGALDLLAADGTFDGIFCDVSLPGVSGRMVFDGAVALHPRLESRFVFVSGSGTAADLSLPGEAPPMFLKKPFSTEDLDRVLARLLETA